MTNEEAKSCIGTIEMLRRLAYNIHGVMDVIDADNCEKIIKVLSDIPKYKDAYNKGWDAGAKATYEHLKMCEEEQEPCEDWYDLPADEMTFKQARQAVKDLRIMLAEYLTQEPKWIPVSERLPELNKPLLVTAYHRVCYAHMISESGNYGYPVFRLHEIKDSDRVWVQETISHGPYSKGRIDAWMYIDIPEPYKVEPQESEE